MASAPKDIRQVLTANRLKDGLVVFLGDGQAWTPWLDDATVARTKEEAVRLEAKGAEQSKMNVVVGAYLIDVVEDGRKLKAAHIREHLRTLGPSVRLDLGKQADEAALRGGPANI